jgi:hypothetical protein
MGNHDIAGLHHDYPHFSKRRATCASTDRPLDFFSAKSGSQAWEAAYLVDAAIKHARSGGGQSVKCALGKCDDMHGSLARLSASEIFEVTSNCIRPTGDACYSIRLDDPLNSWRALFVYLEAVRGKDLKFFADSNCET